MDMTMGFAVKDEPTTENMWALRGPVSTDLAPEEG